MIVQVLRIGHIDHKDLSWRPGHREHGHQHLPCLIHTVHLGDDQLVAVIRTGYIVQFPIPERFAFRVQAEC